MSVSYSSHGGGRPQLGSPVIPINSPARYLRHRIAAERAHRARRQAARFQRLLALLIVGLLYLAVGREILLLTRAKMSLASTELRSDTQAVTTTLKKLLQAKRGDGEPSMTPEHMEAIPYHPEAVPAPPDRP
jgi:hypothetical protein